MLRQLILASASPRRRQLLEQVGYSFHVHPVDVEENISHNLPAMDVPLTLAALKAEAAAEQLQGRDGVVLTADTVVILDNKVLGKPASEAEAYAYLEALSGRVHYVITGFVVRDLKTGKEIKDRELTRVVFRILSEEEIKAYVATGEPMDKAGAYAIQGKGALLVERIEGCYYNVVGLPLPRVALALKEFGFAPFATGEEKSARPVSDND